MLATDHLLTLSTRTWPLYPVVRLWDVLLMEGSAALLASFLALLQMYFLYALGEAKVANKKQVDEIPTDAAERFRELARTGIARDTEQFMKRTRKFIPLVRRGPKENGACKDGDFLNWLRTQADSAGDTHASPLMSPSLSAEEMQEASSRQTSANSGTMTAIQLDEVQASTESQAAAESSSRERIEGRDAAGGGYEERPSGDNAAPVSHLLIQAHVTLDNGTVHVLRVGVQDRCKKVAQRFVSDHSLDKGCTDPLTAWMKKAEAEAKSYPTIIQGSIEDICKHHSKAP
eukprot:TRINITY_DN106920_c0_g1_i1.p1 TRINITY_DN106920_c0_g1~~TRINITY_DN106920_c0_g1_i1.p1  ORF type:complete len:288 (+),score=47.99 TRINITY_DN106920_c0_g1_i1:301-1164(+)